MCHSRTGRDDLGTPFNAGTADCRLPAAVSGAIRPSAGETGQGDARSPCARLPIVIIIKVQKKKSWLTSLISQISRETGNFGGL